MTSDSKTILSFHHVSVRYNGTNRDALANLSCNISEGERTALIGLNGSGKTTVLMAACGLVPHTGTIEVNGTQLIPSTVDAIRENIGVLFAVPDDQILFPRVYDDVAFGLSRHHVPPQETTDRVLSMLQKLDIDGFASSSPYQLSHGQRLRVALAGALVAEPPLLLLDEPSSGLDPRGALSLAGYLKNIPSTILLATHDLPFAAQLCGRFLLLEDGKILRDVRTVDELSHYW